MLSIATAPYSRQSSLDCTKIRFHTRKSANLCIPDPGFFNTTARCANSFFKFYAPDALFSSQLELPYRLAQRTHLYDHFRELSSQRSVKESVYWNSNFVFGDFMPKLPEMEAELGPTDVLKGFASPLRPVRRLPQTSQHEVLNASTCLCAVKKGASAPGTHRSSSVVGSQNWRSLP